MAKNRKRDLDDLPSESQSIYDMDLSRISGAGCLLFLSTIVVIGIFVTTCVVFLSGDLEGRGPLKIVGIAGFLFIAAYFWAGRWVLEKLGFSIQRHKKKRRKRH